MNIRNLEWHIDDRLVERTPGVTYSEISEIADTDNYAVKINEIIYKERIGGETFNNLRTRIKSLIFDLGKTGCRHAVLLSHGGTMQGIMAVIENLNDGQIIDLHKSDKINRFTNGHILHYSKSILDNSVNLNFKYRKEVEMNNLTPRFIDWVKID
jgi:broad specificity phosphatase PhoE